MSVHLLVSPSVRLAIPFLLTTFASNACFRLADKPAGLQLDVVWDVIPTSHRTLSVA